jgi:hypothetical protein
MTVKSTLYVEDFYAWSRQQAALLRAGEVDRADIEAIAEEIESMGRTERRELISRLTVLLVHLLKWKFQPALRGRSWRLSIDGQRLDISDHLADNPSLRAELSAAIAQAYRRALIEASKETGLDMTVFPSLCPFSFDEMMNPDIWPGEADEPRT